MLTQRLVSENKRGIVKRTRMFQPELHQVQGVIKSTRPPPITKGYSISRALSLLFYNFI